MTAAFCVITLSWLFVVLFVIISATTTHDYFTPDTVSLATMLSAAGTMLTWATMCSTGAGLVGSRVYWVIRSAENMFGSGLPLLCRSWSTFRFTYGG